MIVVGLLQLNYSSLKMKQRPQAYKHFVAEYVLVEPGLRKKGEETHKRNYYFST